MKALQKFWFEPKHQRKDKPVVEFELLPLDQRTWLMLSGETRRSRGGVTLTPEGYLEAFRYSVQGWRGLDVEFSQDAKLEMLLGAADRHLGRWQEQIAGELMRRVIVGDELLKNS